MSDGNSDNGYLIRTRTTREPRITEAMVSEARASLNDHLSSHYGPVPGCSTCDSLWEEYRYILLDHRRQQRDIKSGVLVIAEGD